jgi:hypothetical protein
VMEAFTACVMGTLGSSSAARELSSNVALARLMAQESTAALAGEPIAFFAGKGFDHLDSFVTEIARAGARAARSGPIN